MNYTQEFKAFFLKVILPNMPSYKAHFSATSFDDNINKLIENYAIAYDFNLFEGSDPKSILKKLSELKGTENDILNNYNLKIGNGIPSAIVFTHYNLFLQYFNQNLVFKSLQDFIDEVHKKINTTGKKEDFISNFRKFRKEITGQTKIMSGDLLFGSARKDNWTINVGAEKELQYHIHTNKESFIKYGLGFNIQGSGNNHTPVENVKAFKNYFYAKRKEIDNILQDYLFYDNESDLINLNYGTFILYGQEIPIIGNEPDGSFVINGTDFLKLLYDLKHKQFKAYKLIYEGSKLSNSQLTKSIFMNNSMKLLEYKKQIILQGPPGTGKTKTAKELAIEILHLEETENLNNNEQFKLIQFHPSYTYEDFVRGIVSKPNENGEGVLYKTENKILAEFAEKALENLILSQEDNSIALVERWIEDTFEEFKAQIEEKIEQTNLILSGAISIFSVTEDCFRYGQDWQNPARINFIDLKRIIKAVILGNLDLNEGQIPKELSVHGYYRYTYYLPLLRIFFKKYTYTPSKEKVPLKNYVLIIDEINRANLPAVLGELIYALEYRNEFVESMYEFEETREIILPSNLYIIGTMNTADRSVGHIDYAIRRRFAFMDILPKDLSDEKEIIFDTQLFQSVKELFTSDDYKTRSNYLSTEFEPKDVALGQSYFIDKTEDGGSMDIRLEYEIKPILREYIKDGILKESVREKIEQLSTTI